MDKISIYGVTGDVLLDTRREKNAGLYPIKIRITFQRKQVYYNTGFDMTKEQWELLPEARSKKQIEVRKLLKNKFELIYGSIKEVFEQSHGFSFDSLNLKLSNGKAYTLQTSFDNKIKVLIEEGRIGSSIAYQCALSSLNKFNKKDNVLLSDVSVQYLQKYEKWMLDAGNSYTTIGIYLRQLRAILNDAKKNSIISEAQYPFGELKYQIPTSEGIKKALTLDKIKEIKNYTFEKDSVIEKYRDLWLFLYYSNGINVYDMCRLKYSNIKDKEINFYRFKTIRTSTKKKLISIYILPEMKEIIERWGNNSKEGYIFPFLNNVKNPIEEKKRVQYLTKNINKNMRKFCKCIGIQYVTTYAARHSFATILKLQGVNVSFISESLGHSDIKTTEHYLGSFGSDDRKNNAKLLTNF